MYLHEPPLRTSTWYRVDTASGSDTPTTVYAHDGSDPVPTSRGASGSTVKAVTTRDLGHFWSSTATLYCKELDWRGNPTGTVVTSTGQDLTPPVEGRRPLRVDVRDYGPLGLGVATDTAALNAALAAAGAKGTVAIPDNVALHISGVNVNGCRVEGGTLTGVGLETLVTLIGDGPELNGVTLFNEGGTQAVSVFAGTTGPRIIDCVIGAGSTAPDIGVQINSAGISRVEVRGTLFDKCGYGILTNEGASDLDDVKIHDNVFTGISADAIELNHPGLAYTGAARISIQGNSITADVGSGTTAGFGIGIAGATNVAIQGNVFGVCRNQAIHIEDEAAHIAIGGNTFTGSPVAIYGIDGDYLTVEGNTFDAQTGSAITFTFDPTNSPTHYTIAGNTIRGAAVDGISVAADAAQYARIAGNIVDSCGQHGISYTASSGAAPGGRTMVDDNTSTNNGGYGLYVSHHSGARVRGNITGGNALGGYGRPSTTAGLLIPVTDPIGEADAVISAGDAPWTPLFPLGERSAGIVAVTAVRVTTGAQRTQGVFSLSWDGTTLTATPVGVSIDNGAASGLSLRANAGVLEATAACSGADGQTIRLWAQMQGLVLL